MCAPAPKRLTVVSFGRYMASVLTSFFVTTTTSISAETEEVFLTVNLTNRMSRVLNLTVIPDHHNTPRVVGNFSRQLDGGWSVFASSDAGPSNGDGWALQVPPHGETVFTVALTFLKNVAPPTSAPRPVPADAPARCVQLADTDFQPANLGSTDAANVSECCRNCIETHGCVHAAFSDGGCYLKGQESWPVPLNGTVSCTIPNAPPPPPRPPAPHPYDTHAGDRAEASQATMVAKLEDASRKVPSLQSSNDALVQFYKRSVLSVLQCKLTNPAFALDPFWELGDGGGSSVSWDMSFSSALIAMLDPDSLKVMIDAFFHNDILNHTWISLNGQGGGFYVYGPFSAIQLVEDYIAQTGDVGCLDWEVGPPGSPETVLQQLKRVAVTMNATYARPDGLLDVGAGTGLTLEIQTSGYEYVIAEITGLVSNFAEKVGAWYLMRGDTSGATELSVLAKALAKALEQRWDDGQGWYSNFYPVDNSSHFVFTYKMFDMFPGSAVPLENKAAMASRLVDGEFLAEFGLFSISRADTLHWDREDCDWGGGGAYVGQPGKIADALFKLASDGPKSTTNFAEKAWQIIGRMLPWAAKLPYYPQMLYGDSLMLQPHERSWFLQLSAGAGFQAIVHGAFGVRPQMQGKLPGVAVLNVSPSFNETMLAGGANLTGYMFMEHNFDVLIATDGGFVVRVDGVDSTHSAVGGSVQCEIPSGQSPKCIALS